MVKGLMGLVVDNYLFFDLMNNYQQPVPLGPLPRYYNW